MKLYYEAGVCSLSPHIVSRELGIELELERVDIRTHKTASGGDYFKINPKGYVPALVLNDGQVLTEGPAVVQFLADLKPEGKLAPRNGTLERYRLQEMLSFITSEIHKPFSPLFYPDAHEEVKKAARAKLARRYDLVNRMLAGTTYLFGEQFTVADAYLFTVTRWCGSVDFDLSAWPAVRQYQARVAARPAVQAALRAEGLTKS